MRRLLSTLVLSLCLILTECLISQRPALASDHAATPGVTAADPAAPTTASEPLANGVTQQPAVPRLIKFSGLLQNLAGKPISGPVDVTFSLYNDESGGVSLWSETQTVQADALGRYTVLLGAMSPVGVPIGLFTSGEAHWLGVQVSNLPEQPRVLLVSVPYALKAGDAETLGGKPASAFMLAGQAAEATAAKAAEGEGSMTPLERVCRRQDGTPRPG